MTVVHTYITSNKCYKQLFSLTTVRPRLGHHILVQSFNSSLKAGKLHHRVWYLSAPQWHNAFVETENTKCEMQLAVLELLQN